MIGTHELLRIARTYAKAEGIALTTVSSRVFNDGKKLDAIVAGGDIFSGRLNRSLHWFSENWPQAVAWPADIPRPIATPQSEAAA